VGLEAPTRGRYPQAWLVLGSVIAFGLSILAAIIGAVAWVLVCKARPIGAM